MTQVIIQEKRPLNADGVPQEVLDQATEDMVWDCYSHWQDFGDVQKQIALQNYLNQPKVMIDDLADPFDRATIEAFPWEDTKIEVKAPHGINITVSVMSEDPFNNGEKDYGNTIGMGVPDGDGYVPMVFKIKTSYDVTSEDGKDHAHGESTQIQFISDRCICETIDTLTGDMADMARDIYTRALDTYVKSTHKVATLEK